MEHRWAWQNTHMTRHISPDSRLTNGRTNVRISPKTGRPRKRPARPRLSLTDRLANLHLLLGSSSFRRWPLKVTFYAQDVFRVWQRWTAQNEVEALPQRTEVTLDASTSDTESLPETTGIHALAVDYSAMKSHVEKTKATLEASPACICSICEHSLPSDGGATLFCPHDGCNTAGHIECFANAFTKDKPNTIVPTSGSCPSCGTKLQWVELVKELSLRMRGEKEIQKLLKVRKPRATKKGVAVSEPAFAEEEPSDDDEELVDHWHELFDSESELAEPVTRSNRSPIPAFKTSHRQSYDTMAYSEPVIEDSDWEEAMVLT